MAANIQGIAEFVSDCEQEVNENLKVSVDSGRLLQQLIDHKKRESDVK